MPNLLKKIILSFLSALVVFFSFAPYLQVGAQGTTCTPANATRTCPGQTACDVNVSTRYCCPSAAACTQLQSNPPSPTGTSTTSTTGTEWYNQGLGDWFLKVYDTTNPSEIFGERYTAAQVQWVIYGIISFIVNIPFGSKGGAVFSCLIGAPAANQTLGTCLGPAITGLFANNPYLAPSVATKSNQSLLSLVFASDRPISGISYTKGLLQKFTLVPVAYAQTPGFGFSALSAVQDFWTNSRNIAYGLFVFVTIIFAFMIMFRVKINPQTAITVQSAIPKVIISLILVTFSYAIAGFLIDLMYVVIGFISLVTANLIPVVTILGIFRLQPMSYGSSDVFNLLTIGPTLSGVAYGLFGFLMLYAGPLLIIITILVLLVCVTGFIAAVTSLGALSTFSFYAIIVAFIIAIVVLIVVTWMFLKTTWTLLKALANVLLLTIFAPIYLSLGILIPNFGFGQWVKNYISHLAVFVVTGVMLLFAWIFQLKAWQGLSISNLTITASGTTANPWPPLLGTGGGVSLVFAGISFVMFTLIPKSADLVQSFLSGKPFAYGSAAGEALAPVKTAGLYGVAEGLNIAQKAAQGPTPGWVQASRKILNLKP